MPQGPRYHYVDLIRGICALAVLIVHYRWFYADAIDTWPALDSVTLPYDWLLHPVYAHGNIAVQMFWLLSGFVFATAYASEGRGIRLGDFAVARIARLYPLHLATLLYLAALQSMSLGIYGRWTVYGNNDAPHFLSQLFLASNWFTHEGSFNGPIWSVSVEVLIYAAFLAYLKWFGNRPFVAAAFAVAMIGLERVTKLPLAMCGALFFMGVVLAPVADRANKRLGRHMLPLALAAALLGALSIAGAAMMIGPKAEVLAIYGLLPLILLAFIAMDVALPALPRRYHWIGAITFAVYLLHMPVLITARVIFPDIPREVLAGPYLLPAFAAAVVGLAALCYRHFERPMQSTIREWWRGRVTASTQPL